MDGNSDKEFLMSERRGDEWTRTLKARGPRRVKVELESTTTKTEDFQTSKSIKEIRTPRLHISRASPNDLD